MDYESDGNTGAIVYSGLAHMSFNFGYVLKVSLASDGTWPVI
jgi:hypothetical protein